MTMSLVTQRIKRIWYSGQRSPFVANMICLVHLVEKYADVSYLYNSGYTLLRDPHHNKGLSFTEKERDAHYLRGLLPPAVVSQEPQVWAILAKTHTSNCAGLLFNT